MGSGRENELHIYQHYNIENLPLLKMLIIRIFWEQSIETIRENTENYRISFSQTKAMRELEVAGLFLKLLKNRDRQPLGPGKKFEELGLGETVAPGLEVLPFPGITHLKPTLRDREVHSIVAAAIDPIGAID